MRNWFNTIINYGVQSNLTRSEIKITKLLNQISLTWSILLVFFILTDMLILDNYIPTVSGHISMGVLLLIIFILQKKNKTKEARLLFILSAFAQFYVFANYFMRGQLVELFYVLIPLFSILFFKQKWIHYTWLLISIITFIVPHQISPIYGGKLFSDPTTVPIFFVGVFLIVVYFKNMNLQNEGTLEEQKNNAEDATAIINEQKKELENVYNQQKQFFVNVAHEIRTPLTIIKGNNNILATQHTSEESQSIKKQVQNIQQIVDDVLDLAKVDTNEFILQPTPIAINTLLNQVKDSFEVSFQQKNITFSFIDYTPHPIFVSGDNRYLQRAINNIVSNALKYTPEKGRVSVELEQINNQVSIKIIDTGIGIQASDKNLIFKRFFQVKNTINEAGGSGIGLAFTKEIIEKHGGSIQTMTQDKGSCFSVVLPTVESVPIVQETKKITEKNLSSESLILNDKSILIVEDNIDMSLYIKSILTGYNVLLAKNGIEGLALLQQYPTIDLVITDYMMPYLNGYDFILKIREERITTPIIMLTAKADIETRLEVLRLGIDDVLTKPFDSEELLIRIKNSIVNNESKKQYILEEKIENPLPTENEWLSTISQYISNNCHSSTLNIAVLSEEFAMSTSTLFRKIKSQTGLGTKEFITEIKLQKAYALFNDNKEITFSEISVKAGFKNISRFRKQFEERFGITTQYKSL